MQNLNLIMLLFILLIKGLLIFELLPFLYPQIFYLRDFSPSPKLDSYFLIPKILLNSPQNSIKNV